MRKVIIHDPEGLEQWLGPMAEQVKQRIDGTDLDQLFDEAQAAFMVLSAAVMQTRLEDPEDDANATGNLGDAGRLLMETWALYRDPEETAGLTWGKNP